MEPMEKYSLQVLLEEEEARAIEDTEQLLLDRGFSPDDVLEIFRRAGIL